MSSVPVTQLILDYEMFFQQKPNERINLIKHISKENLLTEIAGLNYQLKPNNQLNIDTSEEKQKELLRYYTKLPEYYRAFEIVYNNHKDRNANPIIFNRQACIFALEEIINSDEIKFDEKFILNKVDDWIAILKYLLAINFEITQIKEEDDPDFERINPKLLPLNELSIESNPAFIPYRGYRLLKYFLNHVKYSIYIERYFQAEYKLSIDEFLFRLMSAYFSNRQPEAKHNFFYVLKEEDSLFESLSKRTPNKTTYKLLSIRKSPFIKMADLKYILSDNIFLLEKCYGQFINDFWFDSIKPNKVVSIKEYRADFGIFLEDYVEEILRGSFSNYEHSKLLLFDELKIQYKGQQIEICDVYLRYNNRVLLAEVKSSNIYDEEKYGGDIETLYKNDRNAFFKTFGVNQLVNAIVELENKITIIDQKFRIGRRNEIYPCVIFNDKSLQTPFMAQIFNDRFQELLTEVKTSKKLDVKPLTLIHISDLEILEERFNRSPKDIWNLLRYNLRNKKFIPPFYNTVDRNWDFKKMPEKVMAMYKELIERYNPNALQ